MAKLRLFFVNLWRYLPISRPGKEKVKNVLFHLFPGLFSSWKSYHYWKEARVFQPGPDVTKELSLVSSKRILNGKEITWVAICMHVYYPEVLSSLLTYVKELSPASFRLFITAPGDQVKAVNALLQEAGIEGSYLLEVENRGRDILPFLRMLPKVLSMNPPLILKLHTKKTDRRKTGNQWSTALYDNLLINNAFQATIQVFEQFPEIGLIAAHGHVIPLSLYYGSNPGQVKELCKRMGAGPELLRSIVFAAGSMFFIRPGALGPLLALDLQATDFEAELGQADGTLAHAVERVFAVSTQLAGYSIADTKTSQQNPVIKITRNYPFSW